MTQIAVKLPDELVREIDELVGRGLFPNRSPAVRRGLEAVVAAQRTEAVDGFDRVDRVRLRNGVVEPLEEGDGTVHIELS